MLVVDTTGTVVFYNEPAERTLGVRFEETGRIDPEEADRLVELSDDPAAGPVEAGRPWTPPSSSGVPSTRAAGCCDAAIACGCRSSSPCSPSSIRRNASSGRGDVLGAAGAVKVTPYGVRGSPAAPGASHGSLRREQVPFHHDPGRDDAALDAAIGAAIDDMDPDFPVTPAAEGRSFDLG